MLVLLAVCHRLFFTYALRLSLKLGPSDDGTSSDSPLAASTSDYGTCACSGSRQDRQSSVGSQGWTDSSCHGDYDSDSLLSVGSDNSLVYGEESSTLHFTSTDSDDDDSYFERYDCSGCPFLLPSNVSTPFPPLCPLSPPSTSSLLSLSLSHSHSLSLPSRSFLSPISPTLLVLINWWRFRCCKTLPDHSRLLRYKRVTVIVPGHNKNAVTPDEFTLNVVEDLYYTPSLGDRTTMHASQVPALGHTTILYIPSLLPSVSAFIPTGDISWATRRSVL